MCLVIRLDWRRFDDTFRSEFKSVDGFGIATTTSASDGRTASNKLTSSDARSNRGDSQCGADCWRHCGGRYRRQQGAHQRSIVQSREEESTLASVGSSQITEWCSSLNLVGIYFVIYLLLLLLKRVLKVVNEIARVVILVGRASWWIHVQSWWTSLLLQRDAHTQKQKYKLYLINNKI